MRYQEQARGKHGQDRPERQERSVESASQQSLVAVRQRREALLGPDLQSCVPAAAHRSRYLFAFELWPDKHLRGQHRNHEQGADQGKHDHVGELLEQDAGYAAHEGQGQEDNERRHRAGDHRGRHFPSAPHRRLTRCLTLFLMAAENALQHHYGTVHHQAYAQGQPA